jgi:hypothetical protein
MNASQIRKYNTSTGVLTAEREKLLRVDGKGGSILDSKFSPSPSSVSVRHTPGVSTHPPGLLHRSPFSAEWTRKLVGELEDMLRLDSMEGLAAGEEVEKISREKAALSDATRMKRMMMDSTQMTALLLQNEVAFVEAVAATPALAEVADAPADSSMLKSLSSNAKLEAAELLQKKVRIQVY